MNIKNIFKFENIVVITAAIYLRVLLINNELNTFTIKELSKIV